MSESMQEHNFPYTYIAIEGNIGAGKTTLCQQLAHDFGFRLLLEQFSDNPFLPFFYENPDRYGFPVELFFMTERHKQLQEELAQIELFEDTVVADYFFSKTLLFARNTLKTDEFRLFQRLFDILSATFPKPELLVYLHRSVPDLIRNIKKRGREYEQNIDPLYLENIQSTYLEYFRTVKDRPILILDMENVDFVAEPHYYQHIVSLLSRNYDTGVHHIELQQQKI